MWLAILCGLGGGSHSSFGGISFWISFFFTELIAPLFLPMALYLFVLAGGHYSSMTGLLTIVLVSYLVTGGIAGRMLWRRQTIEIMRDDYNETKCEFCGYDLRATPDRCPECGKTPSVDHAKGGNRR